MGSQGGICREQVWTRGGRSIQILARIMTLCRGLRPPAPAADWTFLRAICPLHVINPISLGVQTPPPAKRVRQKVPCRLFLGPVGPLGVNTRDD